MIPTYNRTAYLERTLLKHILSFPFAREHVILIDEARLFIGEGGFEHRRTCETLFSEHFPDGLCKLKMTSSALTSVPRICECFVSGSFR